MIFNKTSKRIIVKEHSFCSSFLCQFRGLMFTKKRKDFALVFIFPKVRKVALHMFFVFYPITVLFLDDKKKVIEIRNDFLPFQIYFSKVKSKYVIEITASTQGLVRENDFLSF